MPNPESNTSKSSLTYDQTLIKIDAIWKQVRAYHQTEYLLTLRNAANLVGFWLFPVGWTWHEYERWLEEPLSYESKASKVRYLHLDLPNCPAANDRTSCSRAEAYRMTQVEKYVLRFINRLEISNVLYDGEGNPSAFLENLRHSVKWLHVQGGYLRYGKRIAGCFVDALALLDVIDQARKEAKPKAAKYNWLVIERWVRNHIELRGTAESDSEIFVWPKSGMPVCMAAP